MNISRRDTIIIAVLINVGLLAMLFMTALHFEEDQPQEPIQEAKQPIALMESIRSLPEPVKIQEEITIKEQPIPLPVIAVQSDAPVDEVDQVLKNIVPKQEPAPSSPNYLEVTVKRGDALEKIARQNGTTIRELKRINNLTNDALAIGQVLKVPAPKKKTEEIAATNATPAGSYHVLKAGDNPWKIAKQYGVSYEELLKLNGLDEDSARKLKLGDKLRVK
jgi:peptidoglycan endopeptidase LytF